MINKRISIQNATVFFKYKENFPCILALGQDFSNFFVMLIVMRTAFIKLLEFSTLVQEYFLYIILVLGHNDISFSFWGIKLRALSMKSRYYTVELSLTLLEFFNENCFYRLQIRTLFMVKHSGNLEKKNASICLTRNN